MLRDESGLGDLSISRPKSRLDWGIELPFDRDHVCYVWFDALISYLTGAGYPDDPRFAERWARREHLIGKDILKPHAIFWPIMLKAIGLAPYRHLSVHGYWNVDERKMSKSLGNMISPLAMRDRYGFEAFRYFLLREMSFGLDASFSEEALVERVNADLANNLGNLVSRTLNLVEKLCGGAVPEPADSAPPGTRSTSSARVLADRVERELAELRFHEALAAILGFSDALNRYLDARRALEGGEAAGRRSRWCGARLYAACHGAARALAAALRRSCPGPRRRSRCASACQAISRGARWSRPSGSRSRRAAGCARAPPLFPRLEPPAGAA